MLWLLWQVSWAILYLLGLVLLRFVLPVLLGLLTSLVPLCGSLVRLRVGLIASAFSTALWLLPGASCSLFSSSFALVLGLGSLDNVVYKEN